MQMIVWHQLHD